MKFYKRFCCSIYFFLRDFARSDIPVFATYMFTLFLFVMFFYGFDTLIFLLFNTPYLFERIQMYGVVAIAAVVNYFFVFKKKKFLKYERDPLHLLLTLVIIVLVFGGSLALILYAGPRNIEIRKPLDNAVVAQLKSDKNATYY